MNNDAEIGQALDSICLIMLGFYGLTVFRNGNVMPLVDALKEETGYLEFLISLAIIKWAVDNDFTGLAAPIATLAVLSVVLKLSGRFNLTSALSDFATGRAGLFETLGKTLKSSNIKKIKTGGGSSAPKTISI